MSELKLGFEVWDVTFEDGTIRKLNQEELIALSSNGKMVIIGKGVAWVTTPVSALDSPVREGPILKSTITAKAIFERAKEDLETDGIDFSQLYPQG